MCTGNNAKILLERGVDSRFANLYPQLRRIAQHQLKRETPGHTLQATALIHEVYLRIAPQGTMQPDDERYFLAAASRAMRRILVEHARRKKGPSRNPPGLRVSLSDAEDPSKIPQMDLIAMDEALTELAGAYERPSQVVELRFFGGLKVEEAARVLSVSPRTVEMDWRFARAWLLGQLNGEGLS